MNRDQAAESVYSRLKKTLLIGVISVVAAILLGATIFGLLDQTTRTVTRVVRTTQKAAVSGGSGVVTLQQCHGVSRGLSYSQVVKLLGWPKRVSDSDRHGWTEQQTDGTELDYPITGESYYFTPLCAVVFGSKYGTVDHKWADL